MSKYSLLGYELTFGDEVDKFAKVYKEMRREMSKVSQKYETVYRKRESIENVIEGFQDKDGCGVLSQYVEKCYKKLFDYNIFDLPKETFLSEYCGNLEPALEVCEQVIDLYQSILKDYQQEIKYNEFKKASRGKVIGGGFGFEGAMKGMAQAAAINAGTGMLYDLRNKRANRKSAENMEERLIELYNEKDVKNALKNGLAECVMCIYYGFMACVNDRCGYTFCLDYDFRKAETMEENARHISDSEKRKEILVSALLEVPFRISIYNALLVEYGDINGTLEKISQRFCYEWNYKLVKGKRIDYFLKNGDYTSKDNVTKVMYDININCALLGVDPTDKVEALNRIIKSYEDVMFCCDGYEYDDEDEVKNAIAERDEFVKLTKNFNAGDEKNIQKLTTAVQAFRSKSSRKYRQFAVEAKRVNYAYHCQFDGEIYDCPETVSELEEEYQKLLDIIDKVQIDDAMSIEEAIERCNQLKYRSKHVEDVVEFLSSILNATKQLNGVMEKNETEWLKKTEKYCELIKILFELCDLGVDVLEFLNKPKYVSFFKSLFISTNDMSDINKNINYVYDLDTISRIRKVAEGKCTYNAESAWLENMDINEIKHIGTAQMYNACYNLLNECTSTTRKNLNRLCFMFSKGKKINLHDLISIKEKKIPLYSGDDIVIYNDTVSGTSIMELINPVMIAKKLDASDKLPLDKSDNSGNLKDFEERQNLWKGYEAVKNASVNEQKEYVGLLKSYINSNQTKNKDVLMQFQCAVAGLEKAIYEEENKVVINIVNDWKNADKVSLEKKMDELKEINSPLADEYIDKIKNRINALNKEEIDGLFSEMCAGYENFDLSGYEECIKKIKMYNLHEYSEDMINAEKDKFSKILIEAEKKYIDSVCQNMDSATTEQLEKMKAEVLKAKIPEADEKTAQINMYLDKSKLNEICAGYKDFDFGHLLQIRQSIMHFQAREEAKRQYIQEIENMMKIRKEEEVGEIYSHVESLLAANSLITRHFGMYGKVEELNKILANKNVVRYLEENTDVWDYPILAGAIPILLMTPNYYILYSDFMIVRNVEGERRIKIDDIAGIEHSKKLLSEKIKLKLNAGGSIELPNDAGRESATVCMILNAAIDELKKYIKKD